MLKKFFLSLTSYLIASHLLAAQKPNIIIFFIDDMGVTDIGVNGSSFYETPHIDALAKSGANFTNAYSAHPVCSPTRASLMSGKAPQRVGITQWLNSKDKIGLPLEEVTIAEAFKEANYRTGYIGKWHLGKLDKFQPKHQGFDYTFAVNRAGQPASFFYPFKRGKSPANVPDLGTYKKNDYLTDAITDQAIQFIDKKGEQPFLLCISHYAVHTPIQAPKELVEKYAKKRRDEFGTEKPKLIKGKYGTTILERQENAEYAAMVENLDTNIGRVMTHLSDNKLLENTIIVFTSDNGGLVNKPYGPTSNAPYRYGKAWNYEGGIRIPTIISWPGTIKPLSSDTRTITMDLYPTLLDLSGQELKPKQHLDGTSLKPLLIHNQSTELLDSRFLAWTYPHKHGNGHKPSHAILKGDWKLLKFENDEPSELYNLSKDIGESKNVADQNPELVTELTKALDQWLIETNASYQSK